MVTYPQAFLVAFLSRAVDFAATAVGKCATTVPTLLVLTSAPIADPARSNNRLGSLGRFLSTNLLPGVRPFRARVEAGEGWNLGRWKR